MSSIHRTRSDSPFPGERATQSPPPTLGALPPSDATSNWRALRDAVSSETIDEVPGTHELSPTDDSTEDSPPQEVPQGASERTTVGRVYVGMFSGRTYERTNELPSPASAGRVPTVSRSSFPEEDTTQVAVVPRLVRKNSDTQVVPEFIDPSKKV